MRPAPFRYLRPESLDAVLGHLYEGAGQARVLAGGQSLIPLMNRRLERPAVLVDLARVPGLRYLVRDGEALRVGAMTTHADLECTHDPGIRRDFGVLPRTAALIGHRPVRLRGTLAGSIAHAEPRAQWCLLAVLLDAQVLVRGPDGSRTMAAGQVLIGRHRTALRPDEVIVEVCFPRAAPGAALEQFALEHQGLPVAAAAADIRLDDDGRVAAARIALGGTSEGPVRMSALERELLGLSQAGAAMEGVIRAAVEAAAVEVDLGFGTGGHRTGTDLAAVMLHRAVVAAASRAADARGPGRAQASSKESRVSREVDDG